MIFKFLRDLGHFKEAISHNALLNLLIQFCKNLCAILCLSLMHKLISHLLMQILWQLTETVNGNKLLIMHDMMPIFST